MATKYPSAPDSFESIDPAAGLDVNSYLFNSFYDALETIEGELGIDVAGSYSTVSERLNRAFLPSGSLSGMQFMRSTGIPPFSISYSGFSQPPLVFCNFSSTGAFDVGCAAIMAAENITTTGCTIDGLRTNGNSPTVTGQYSIWLLARDAGEQYTV